MFHHKKLNAWQRIVLAFRDINAIAKCGINCPGCGSSQVSGGNGGPYLCKGCGSMWQ